MLNLALIGHPVGHSLSPLMHRAALDYCGIAGNYELIDIEPKEVFSALDDLRARGINAFNVTVPHKEMVMELMENLTDAARLVGAVNTVRFDSHGVAWGHNTDLQGFVLALNQMSCKPERDEALVIGSGGAARACLAGLAVAGYKQIHIAARNVRKGEGVAREFRERIGDRFTVVPLDDWSSLHPQVVVNCTPIGLGNEELPVWIVNVLDQLSGAAILDTVYGSAGGTRLVEACWERGYEAIDGKAMLAGQAQLAFEFWTGRAVPYSVMRDALPA